MRLAAVGRRDPGAALVDACHGVFAATTDLAVNVVRSLDAPYWVPATIPRKKADGWILERTLAFMIDSFAARAFDMSGFFAKVHQHLSY